MISLDLMKSLEVRIAGDRSNCLKKYYVLTFSSTIGILKEKWIISVWVIISILEEVWNMDYISNESCFNEKFFIALLIHIFTWEDIKALNIFSTLLRSPDSSDDECVPIIDVVIKKINKVFFILMIINLLIYSANSYSYFFLSLFQLEF